MFSQINDKALSAALGKVVMSETGILKAITYIIWRSKIVES